MSLTPFPNGISSFGSPITASPSLWMANGAKAFFAGGPNHSDDNKGTDYDRPVTRMSNVTANSTKGFKNSSTGSVEHGTRGAGDFLYVSTGTYAENVFRKLGFEQRKGIEQRRIALIHAHYEAVIRGLDRAPTISGALAPAGSSPPPPASGGAAP